MKILLIISILALGGVIFFPIGYHMGNKKLEKEVK